MAQALLIRRGRATRGWEQGSRIPGPVWDLIDFIIAKTPTNEAIGTALRSK